MMLSGFCILNHEDRQDRKEETQRKAAKTQRIFINFLTYIPEFVFVLA
jgi:hypothetical protein